MKKSFLLAAMMIALSINMLAQVTNFQLAPQSQQNTFKVMQTDRTSMALQAPVKAPASNYTYEPTTVDIVDITGTKASVTNYGSYFSLEVYSNDYSVYSLCFTPTNGNIPGHYPCGTSETDQTPGTFQFSQGLMSNSVYRTFVGHVNGTSIDIQNYNLYFIVGGYFDIAQNGSNYTITGNLQSYNGSKITVTYTGQVDGINSDPSYAYEPTEATTINISATSLEMGNSSTGAVFMDIISSDYSAYLQLFPSSTGLPGRYTVGTSTTVTTPGTILRSAGIQSNSVTRSFVGYINDEGYIDLQTHDLYFITGGQLDIAQSGTTYQISGYLTSYNGSIINIAYTGQAADTRYNYEPDDITTIDITGTAAEATLFDGYYAIDISGETYGAYLIAAPNGTDIFAGSYTVSPDSENFGPGNVLYSDGIADNSVSRSFIAVVNDEGYIDLQDYDIYFITGGSMTVTENGSQISLNAVFTTAKGSTINLTYNGTPSVDDRRGEDAVENTQIRPSVFTEGMSLIYEGEGTYAVFTLSGQRIYSGSAARLQLPAPGAYIIIENNGQISKIIAQ